ncbi:MAG: winged helix-turn-helix domain-containing protein [Betaproteobacteria bacterium]|nr:winged helix-turn-helix domain-containing protein [Betaproteobacteria bacterium]MDE2047189.1 winged helix-turn-helix domain-containing protein [Betaproteobacteria bacterium]
MSAVLRFPGCEIDVALRVLRVRGAAVQLSGRAFDLLLAMAERAGHVVTKDELLDQVWGDKPVGDYNLHVHISSLRRHVGREAIRTVPGRGYCFALPTERVTPLPAAPAAIANTPHAPEALLTQPIGREQDLQAVQALLDTHRLVIITGAGGVGKTLLARVLLAREHARHADGVVRVDLTAIDASSNLPAAIATALRVVIDASQPLASLTSAARPLRAAVLLDNADTLVEPVCAVVSALLEHCPHLHLIVTSQAPLALRAAHIYHLEPLALPAPSVPASEALHAPALALLAERMASADRHACIGLHEVNDAVDICRQLDGVPLAIELIAPRCATFGLARVRAELPQRLAAVATAEPQGSDRQSNLANMMAWSYALLTPPQQIAFRRLGVCSGGFGLDLARHLLPHADADPSSDGLDLLADLVDHGLVAVDTSWPGRVHYRLLESARHYALGLLQRAGELQAARDAHARAVAQLLEAAHADFWHLPEATFVAHYEHDLDNVRTAIAWCVQGNETPAAIAMAGASGPVWRCLSLHHEGVALLHSLALHITPQSKPHHAARLWSAIALLYGETASVEGREPARLAAALYERLGDAQGRYLALAHLAYSFRYAGADEATEAWRQVSELEDAQWPAAVRLFGARAKPEPGALEARVRDGRAINQVRLALATACGSDYEVNCAMVNLADLALTAGETDEAVRLNRALLKRLGRRHMASRVIALGNLLEALVLSDALTEAEHTTQEFLDAARSLNFMFGMFAADALSLLCAKTGRVAAAAHVLGYADHNYGARHRERGPNEQRLHDEVWAVLEQHTTAQERDSWMSRGATLSAESVCLLAIGRTAAPDNGGVAQHNEARPR